MRYGVLTRNDWALSPIKYIYTFYFIITDIISEIMNLIDIEIFINVLLLINKLFMVLLTVRKFLTNV